MRRLVITICPREPGRIALAIERGGPIVRMGAAEMTGYLERLIGQRDLTDRVTLRQGCAGGCSGTGPNVSVTLHAMPRPGERPDHVAIGWRTYVASLATLPCLASVIDDNLDDMRTRRTRSAR